MDKKNSHLQSLHSEFLKEWLKCKIEMVQRDISFIFETEHLEKIYILIDKYLFNLPII